MHYVFLGTSISTFASSILNHSGHRTSRVSINHAFASCNLGPAYRVADASTSYYVMYTQYRNKLSRQVQAVIKLRWRFVEGAIHCIFIFHFVFRLPVLFHCRNRFFFIYSKCYKSIHLPLERIFNCSRLIAKWISQTRLSIDRSLDWFSTSNCEHRCFIMRCCNYTADARLLHLANSEIYIWDETWIFPVGREFDTLPQIW